MTVEPDAGEPTVDVPGDLAAALAESGGREAFDQLTPFRRREMVQSVTSAKRAEARERRIAQAIDGLTDRQSPWSM